MSAKANNPPFLPYEVLGLTPSASKTDIEYAYARRARETHPDRGGSEQAFRDVKRAYDILIDDAARLHYDRTGEVPGEAKHEPIVVAMGVISPIYAKVLMEMAEDDRMPAHNDVCGFLRNAIEKDIAGFKTRLKILKTTEQIARGTLGRFSKPSGDQGENLLERLTQSQLVEIAEAIKILEQQIADHDIALSLIAAYRFDHEPTWTMGTRSMDIPSWATKPFNFGGRDGR